MELPTWCSFGSLQSLLLGKQVVHKPFPVMTLSRLLNVKKKKYIQKKLYFLTETRAGAFQTGRKLTWNVVQTKKIFSLLLSYATKIKLYRYQSKDIVHIKRWYHNINVHNSTCLIVNLTSAQSQRVGKVKSKNPSLTQRNLKFCCRYIGRGNVLRSLALVYVIQFHRSLAGPILLHDCAGHCSTRLQYI